MDKAVPTEHSSQDGTSPDVDLVTLTARVARTEAENARLRAALADSTRPAPPPDRAPRPGRPTLRHVLAALLALVGVLLVPVAVVGTYVSDELRDTDRFVETFGPLAQDPQIQAMIIDAVVASADRAIGVDALVAEAFTSLDSLDVPPRAAAALALLEGPAADGIRSALTTATERVVTSGAFATTWTQMLQLTHAQLVGALEGDVTSTVVLGDDGTVGLRLGPVVAQVKQQLVSSGVGLASLIPEIDRTIVLVQSDQVATATVVYPLVMTLAQWLPWIALALVVGAVALSVRRAQTLLVVALSVAATMLLFSVLLDVGRATVRSALASTDVSPAAATTIYDAAVELVATTSRAVTVLAVVVALVASCAGPGRTGRAVRRVGTVAARQVHVWIDPTSARAVSVGTWTDQHAVQLRAGLAAALVAVLLVTRPPTTAGVLTVAATGLVVLAALEVLRRAPEAAPGVPDDVSPIVTVDD